MLDLWPAALHSAQVQAFGNLNSRLACCQVIEHKLTAAEKDTIKQELEATVGLQMDHPNVVHTFKHMTRLMSPVRLLCQRRRGWERRPSVVQSAADNCEVLSIANAFRRDHQPGAAGCHEHCTLFSCSERCQAAGETIAVAAWLLGGRHCGSGVWRVWHVALLKTSEFQHALPLSERVWCEICIRLAVAGPDTELEGLDRQLHVAAVSGHCAETVMGSAPAWAPPATSGQTCRARAPAVTGGGTLPLQYGDCRALTDKPTCCLSCSRSPLRDHGQIQAQGKEA